MSDVEAKLDELRKTHGRLVVYTLDSGAKVAFKKASLADLQRLTDTLVGDKGSQFSALKQACLSCCVYPESSEDVKAVFEEAPGIILTASGEIQRLAGVGIEAEKKE